MLNDNLIRPDARIFPGTGEMVRTINEKDWAQTVLGRQEHWPDAIHSTVKLCLNSQFQQCVLAGPELVYIYNDACSDIFGDKHPDALGRRVRDVWPEAWDCLEPLLTGVLATGQPCRLDDLRLVLNRSGFSDECHFDASYSPIHGADNAIVGVFVTTVETTQQVVSERRQRWLGLLAIHAAQRHATNSSIEHLRDLLGSNPHDLPLAVLYVVDGDSATQVFCSGLRSAGRRVPQAVPWPASADGSAAHPFSELALTGEPRLLDASVMLDPDDRCGTWDTPPLQLMALPLVLGGRDKPRGLLVVALSPLVRCDDSYLGFLHTTAGLVATVIASADALEAERRGAEALAELDLSNSRFSTLHQEVAAIRDDLAQVVEGTSDALISYDHQLTIRSLNVASAQVFGREPQELVGKPLLEVAPELAGSPLHTTLQHVAASGQPSVVEYYYQPGQRWYEVRVLPAPYGLLSFGADVTTRKEAERATLDANARLELRVHERTRELREAHQLLAAVFDRAPGGIAITSIEGRYLRVNPAYASMLGYDTASMARRRLEQLVDPSDYLATCPCVARVVSGELDSCETEMRFRRASGETIWVLSFLSVIEDQEQPRYLVHIAKDVTRSRMREAERKAAQDELQSLYRRLETVREMERTALAREVHDQLGQILSAAKIDLRLLEDLILRRWPTLAPELLAQELRGASGTLDRALRIVRQIATTLRAPELDGQGLYAALEWHSHDFEQRTRIRVGLELAAGLPQPEREVAEALLRIFQEALTNVLRHAHASEVRVTLERRGERVLLRVRDNGQGIERGRRARAGSLGITGMRERARLVHGRLLIGPLAPQGTLVSALLPMKCGERDATTDILRREG
jgi:PAS domain S-box-containing protein